MTLEKLKLLLFCAGNGAGKAEVDRKLEKREGCQVGFTSTVYLFMFTL